MVRWGPSGQPAGGVPPSLVAPPGLPIATPESGTELHVHGQQEGRDQAVAEVGLGAGAPVDTLLAACTDVCCFHG